MRFVVTQENGALRAEFNDAGAAEKTLLPLFLICSPFFVPDMLYEISLVERLAARSSGFESESIEVTFYNDKVVIDLREHIEGIPDLPLSITLPLQSAKLMLMQWGIEVHLWMNPHLRDQGHT